ncbi:hypothetical protein [Moraxella lacunata]
MIRQGRICLISWVQTHHTHRQNPNGRCISFGCLSPLSSCLC